MKAKTITAKIRDAVPVCFMVDGDEVARYKNIEIPALLKELEIRDFGFNTLADGKIEFNLYFDRGMVPTEFPAPRPKVTRAEKAAAKAAATDAAPAEAQEAPADAGSSPVMETPDDAHTATDAANATAIDETPDATPDAAVDATTGATTDATNDAATGAPADADMPTDTEPPVKATRKPGRPAGRKNHGN